VCTLWYECYISHSTNGRKFLLIWLEVSYQYSVPLLIEEEE
jgi:hypothetical protein